MFRQSAESRTRRRKINTIRQIRHQRTRARTFERLEDRTMLAVLPLGPLQGGTPDYYGGVANWAYSPQPTVDANTQSVSGGIQKFVDSLPGLYFASSDSVQDAVNLAAAKNNLGQYIPVAVPDTTTYPGSDYYEIVLVQYTEKMSSSLKPTTLRGYVQVETPVNASYSHHVALTYPDGAPILNAGGAQVYGLTPPEYLGPTVVSAKDRPVRIKFTNYLPTGEGGDLFLPVDTATMGAGAGPNMAMPMMADRVGGAGATVEITTMAMADSYVPVVGQLVNLTGFTPAAYNGEFRVTAVPDATHFQVALNEDPGGPATVVGNAAEAYTENRATLHLHGGNTVWISDGNQNQWITPAGENTNYPAGVSTRNVPDMPDPGPGSETFFYSNQEAARLMFYHDHAFGITRLNVYAGEAAGYLITDAVEQDLIQRGVLPDVGIPLIIQDKTFIDTTPGNGGPKVLETDPTWPLPIDDAKSDLWTPHVYMPNQNPNSEDGANPMGRWDYGPFFWPPWPTTHLPLTNPTGITLSSGGSGYTLPPVVTITPADGDTTGSGATATATIDPVTGAVTAINLVNPGTAYTSPPVVTITPAAGDATGADAAATVDTILIPNLPDVSMTMESFQDTPLVNGTAYPFMDVQPQAYRFRVLNGANDRFWNLQLYTSSTIVSQIKITDGGSGYINPPLVTITPAAGDTVGMGATADATIDPVTGAVIAITLVTVGSGYTAAPIVSISEPPAGGTRATATATIYTGASEVGMVPAVKGAAAFPVGWTTQTIGQPGNILDSRFGGVPDPRTIGPSIIQIGTEGGFLPSPVIWPNTPIGYERNPKNIVVGSVAEHNLFLGAAERADIIIDFSQFVGKTVILYNDGPSACPAADSRMDYFTGDMAQLDTGGTNSTLPGYGPNVRTIMAFRVSATGVPVPFDLAKLKDEFKTTPTHQSVFVRDQDPIIVPQKAYNDAYGTTSFPSATNASSPTNASYETIQSMSLTFRPLNLSTPAVADQVATPVKINNESKAIHELFENEYGRMQAVLGVELNFTNGANQTTIPFTIKDPVTEILTDTPNLLATPIGSASDGTQIWKITHNGVDTHPIHFHLFNVQVLNRVGWDGAIRAPDANELGWKETVRMNPLEDIIVALRPTADKTPFGVPDSIRLLDPTMPQGSTMGFSPQGPDGNPVAVTNEYYNFGWEYVWHCHILSHEEMDMMRPMQFNVARALPAAPVLTTTVGTSLVDLLWIDPTPSSASATLGNPTNEIGFRIERADVDAYGVVGAYASVGSALANATTFRDTTVDQFLTYSYRVIAFNAAGGTASNAAIAVPPQKPAAPTVLTGVVQFGPPLGISLTWLDNATNETGFVVQRSDDGGAFVQIAAPTASAGTGNTTYLDTTVVYGKTYAYRVYAANGNFVSGFSNTATAITLAAPSNLAGTPVVGPQVSLTWTDNATNEIGFTVWRSTNGGAFAQIALAGVNAGTGSVTYVDVTAQSGNTYAYKVSAVNGSFASAFSNTATVIVAAAPAAPTSLTGALQASIGAAPQIALTFRDNATNETGFVIERQVNGGAFAPLVTLPPKTGTGTVTYTDPVTAGNVYAYRVSAVNGAAQSGYSNTVTVTSSAPTLAPTSLTAALRATAGTAPQIALTFRDNATNETGFVIERQVNGAAFAPLVSLPLRAGTGTVSYTDTVTAGNLYAYRVSALNGAAQSAYSNTVSVTVPAAPAAPANFAGVATATSATRAQVVLSWTDNSTSETQFVIRRATNAAFTAGLTTATVTRTAAQSTATGGTVSLTQTNLVRGTTYYYQILARNAYGDSVWVNLTSFPIVM